MEMWKLLGFNENPYDVRPLKPRKEHVEFLVGRKKEGISFLTTIDSAHEGIFVISGAPGVGKTSFFNIYQYLLESGSAPFGPKLMAARIIAPILNDDNTISITKRVLQSFHKSIVEYCSYSNTKIPKKVEEIGKWVNATTSTGFDFGLQICGFGGNIGRHVQLPKLSEATFEHMQDALECLNDEVINTLKFQGAFIVLDNMENLDDSQLSDLLMSLRDTLFSIPCIWWILIGQSGLGSLIQTLDPRVSDRITGSGLELMPISVEDLMAAIKVRTNSFHNTKKSTVLLPDEIYRHLYNASHGEIRFVFKYCANICTHIIKELRETLLNSEKKYDDEIINGALSEFIVNDYIQTGFANSTLKKIIASEISQLQLRPKDKIIIKYLNSNPHVRPKEFHKLKFKSAQDFYSNYLRKLFEQHLIIREQEGKQVRYKLRGLSYLAAEYELID